MNRQQGATVFLPEKMCGISKSDFEFSHIANVKQKLSVFKQRDQGSFRSPVFKTVTFLQKHLFFALFCKKHLLVLNHRHDHVLYDLRQRCDLFVGKL